MRRKGRSPNINDLISRTNEWFEFARLSIDRAAEGIYWVDAKGRFYYVNETACRSLGYGRDELLNMSVWDIDKDVKKKEWPYLWRYIVEYGSATYESLNRKKDGTVFPVEVSVNFLEFGGKEFCCKYVRDISDRKQAEESLRLMQSLLDSTVDEASLATPDGRFYYVNEAKCRSLGYARDELLSMYVWDVDPGITKEEWPDIWEGIKKNGFIKLENIHKRKDGRVFPTELWANYLNYNGQEFVCAFVRDIRDRKRTEEKLRESEAFLNNVFDCIQDGICVLDRDYNIIRVNHTMEAWYSGSMPLVGKKCYEVYHCKSEPRGGCPSAQAIKEKTPHMMITLFEGEKSRGRWFELYAFPLIDRSGNVVGVIEHVRDITKRMHAEQERETLLGQLNIERDRLREAKSQAELYVDLMGHDINNMNQVAMGYLELALNILDIEQGLDEDDRTLILKPMEALKNSSQLIHNVRKIQRMHAGDILSEAIDLGSVLEQVREEFASVRGREIVIHYVPIGKCMVKANSLLRDVFSNIVGNAIKHSTGALHIIVDLQSCRIGDKDYYKVKVEDTGPGIPDKAKKHLFSRFRAGKTGRGGKGLGLYIVKTLVESYGGKVWVEDRVPGDYTKGTRFSVILPAYNQ